LARFEAVSDVETGSLLPTLSIVVPNYNHGHFLRGALAQCLAQNPTPEEIIVVDDASTDDSVAIIDEIAAANPSLRIVRLKANSGVNQAANLGLSLVRSECVAIVAADDLLLPDFACRALAALAAHPGAAFCFSDPAELVDDAGAMRSVPLYPARSPSNFTPLDLSRLLRRNFFTFQSNSIVYRTDRLRSIGGYRAQLMWFADSFANFVLGMRYGACYVPAVLGVFRVSADSYSAVGRRDARAQRIILEKFLELLSDPILTEIAAPLREAGVVPEMSLRTLRWLLAMPKGRRYLTAHLAFRLAAAGVWNLFRERMPLNLRRFARRHLAKIGGRAG
jgi:glycosyltransferase involved in cell wall biosynthesis